MAENIVEDAKLLFLQSTGSVNKEFLLAGVKVKFKRAVRYEDTDETADGMDIFYVYYGKHPVHGSHYFRSDSEVWSLMDTSNASTELAPSSRRTQLVEQPANRSTANPRDANPYSYYKKVVFDYVHLLLHVQDRPGSWDFKLEEVRQRRPQDADILDSYEKSEYASVRMTGEVGWPGALVFGPRTLINTNMLADMKIEKCMIIFDKQDGGLRQDDAI